MSSTWKRSTPIPSLQQHFPMFQTAAFWFCLVLAVASGEEASTITSPSDFSPSSPFVVVVDGGSTGSRVHVFEFVEAEQSSDTSGTLAASYECVRRGTARAHPALSDFGRTPDRRHVPLNASEVAQHLLTAFQEVAAVVPRKYQATTPVKYQATAGMRLLDEDEQIAVYDALYQGLIEAAPQQFPFSLQREDIGTLSGDLEAFYGVVAANYLKGTINAELELIADADDDVTKQSSGPIGALDMGGSSTQIVYLPGLHPHSPDTDELEENMACKNPEVRNDKHGNNIEDSETCHPATEAELPSRLNGKDLFATSYLSYGVDQFRERLWNTWIAEAAASETASDHVIDNPCTFRGYEVDWNGYRLIGTGDAHKCVEEVVRHIPHPELIDQHHQLGSHVGGIEHPPIRGQFFAMSVYFFALDSMRVLCHAEGADIAKEDCVALDGAWPTPSIHELYNALDDFCSRSWQGDLEDFGHAHPFTKPESLPHRCLECVYLVTLLRDGFGFEPHSRDITFTFLVDGSEVEWSLGMALALHAQQQQLRREQDEQKIPSPNPSSEINNQESQDASAEGGEQKEHQFDDDTKKEQSSNVPSEKGQNVDAEAEPSSLNLIEQLTRQFFRKVS